MFTISSNLLWNKRSIAVAFYTYILHTRVDVEIGDIVFVEYSQENGFSRYLLDITDDSNFFALLASVKIIGYSLDEVKDSVISMLVLDEKVTRNFSDSPFSIVVKSSAHDFTVDFLRSFSYAQQSNFEKFFMRVVRFTIEHGDCNVKDFSLLSIKEQTPLLHAFDNTAVDYDENDTVLNHFDKSYLYSPQKECVAFKGQSFSYLDIEKQSNKIANLISKESNYDDQPGVMIYMERSEKIVSSILAIMKLGGFYLPVDISTPKGRVADIIQDSHVRCVLTDNEEILNDPHLSCPAVNINHYDSMPEGRPVVSHAVNSHSRGYMIYTSGSTGKPKGVLITNKNIANFCSNNILQHKAAQIEHPCLYAVNKVGFDAFVADTLLPLFSGFKIVMASSEELDNPNLFVQTIKRERVNIIQTTPTRINVSILNYSPEALRRIKVIACGGEPLVNEMITKIRQYAPSSSLLNVYGPTETTVWSITADLSEWDRGIGKPSQNTTCFILNRFQKLMPQYETGVLYIGGDGLGTYPFDDKNNNQSFHYVESVGRFLYNSNDTAYLDNNYFINYVSRVDSQVKINGVRIELGELESAAKRYPQIKLCAAAVKSIESIGNRLVFYYTSDVEIDRATFTDKIFVRLPAAYIPNFFVRLPSIPLTSSNKIDRKSLPLPKLDAEELVLPRTPVEQALYNSCKRTKKGIAIGINKPLSEYGFQSTDMPQILTYLLEQSIDIQDFRILNNGATIEQIANAIVSRTDYSERSAKQFPNTFFSHYHDVSKIKTCLLTGASGFLGVHILHELIKFTDANVICLIHNSEISKAYSDYWHGEQLPENRVTFVRGSLDADNFGLSDDDLELIETVDSIINCAASVKYFGDYETIQRNNVLSVKHLLDFAIRQNILLNHISTLSVLGQSDDNAMLDERSFWVGQNEIFANQYIESKFNAENEIRKRISDGLKYRIIRVGRLAWRHEDGVFQPNFNDNEFYSILRVFLVLQKAPKELADVQLEISPIDECAKAIRILCNQKNYNGIFHVMNPNFISIGSVISILNEEGAGISLVPMTEFMDAFNGLDNDSRLKSLLQMCCVRNNEFHVENNPRITNHKTSTILKSFNWSKLDRDYIKWFLSINHS